jgi:hypothetical protein
MNYPEERLPLWHFMYGSRSEQDELAYRNHYLANDVRQIKGMSYAAMGFMFALTLRDLPNLGENPDLLTGIVLRFLLFLFGLVITWFMRPDQSHQSIDLKVIIFSCLTAVLLLSYCCRPGVSPLLAQYYSGQDGGGCHSFHHGSTYWLPQLCTHAITRYCYRVWWGDLHSVYR